jgi:hypothetical protein
LDHQSLEYEKERRDDRQDAHRAGTAKPERLPNAGGDGRHTIDTAERCHQ